MQDYSIMVASSTNRSQGLNQIKIDVKDMLGFGWQVSGGITVIIDGGSYTFYQTLVRNQPTVKETVLP
jgi:hypothetical protein